MDLKLDIDKAAIEAAVTQAIVGSSIGESIKNAVDKALNEKQPTSSSYGAPRKSILEMAVDEVVQQEIRHALSEHMRSRREPLKALIAAHLTDDVLQQTVTAMWEATLEKVRR